MDKINIGIVILNFNNFTDTINCLNSVYTFCLYQNVTTVIVDNGSDNESIPEISTYYKKKQIPFQLLNSDNNDIKINEQNIIIKTNENLGYAKGNNLGLTFLLKLQIDYILILNNDILLLSDIITPLINCLNSNPDIGMISPLLFKDESNLDYNCCRVLPTNSMLFYESLSILKMPIISKKINKKYLLKSNPQLIDDELIPCDIISGSCMMAKSSIWALIDGFDPNTFLYYEENILSEKLKQHNYKMAVFTPVKAIHLGAKATRKTKNIKLLKIELNSLTYYMKKYKKSGIVIIFLIRLIKMTYISVIATYNVIR